jgi:hypothetical protein
VRSETSFRDVLFTSLGDTVYVDYRIVTERGKVIDFAINVTLAGNGCREDVYRVDTKHGRLHEQRFWISPELADLEAGDYGAAFLEKRTEVLKRCLRWAKLFKESKERK